MTLRHITQFKIFSSDLSSYINKLKILSNAIKQNKPDSKLYSGKISSQKLHKLSNINKYHLKSNNPTELVKSTFLNNYMRNTHQTAFERGQTQFPIFHSITSMKKLQSLQAQQKCQFSTFKALLGMKDITPSIDKCDAVPEKKRKKQKRATQCPPMPPCLKYRRPPGKTVKISKTMGCGTICMPCCPKARYPPMCYVSPQHRKCTDIIPNPRPAYSECHRDRSKCRKSLCDCCIIKPPPCKLLPDLDEECM